LIKEQIGKTIQREGYIAMEAKYLSHDNIYPTKKRYTLFIYDDKYEYAYGKHLQYHDFYEVQLVQAKNNDKNEVQGYITLGNQEYPLYNNNLVLVNLFEKHKIDITSKNCYRYCLDISPNIIHFASSQESNLLNIFSNKNNIYPIRELKDHEANALIALFKSFQSATIENGFDIFEKGLILLILSHIFDNYHDDLEYKTANSKHMTLIFDIIQFIDLNIENTISLDSLSNELHFSTYYLCHIFKKYTGFTLGKYIIDKKIEIAKKILLTHEAADVAKTMGFDNYSNFFRAFKKTTGLSPSEYKKISMKINK